MGKEMQLVELKRKLYGCPKRRYRQEDGSAPEGYQRGCTIVVMGWGKDNGIWRWNKKRHDWEKLA